MTVTRQADGLSSADETSTLVTLGMTWLEQGRVTDAVFGARRVLALEPASAEAFFLLGVAAGRLGQPSAALRFLARAVRLRPDFAEAHLNLGHVLEGLGHAGPALREFRLATQIRPHSAAFLATLGHAYQRRNQAVEVMACFQQALGREVRDADCWAGLGTALLALGRSDDARGCFEEALRHRPDDVDLRNSLGVMLRGVGEDGAARERFAGALTVAPGHVPAMINLAASELRAGRAGRAVQWARRALAIESDRAEAWNTLGLALRASGSLAGAAETWKRAVALNPAGVDALGNLGGARRDEERFAEAETLLRRALRVAPQHAALHGILAYALNGQGRPEAAEAACRRALALAPAQADPMVTLGLVEQRRGAPRAVRWFDRAIAVAPRHALARFNRSLVDLEQGALPAGWANYRTRFDAGRAGRERRFAIPEWRGEPLAGKRLFIWREQGVGDEFLFASCYADAIKRADRVIIECERRLVPLFARSFPRAIVRAEQPLRGLPVEEAVDCDFHIPAGSLPGLLRGEMAAFPPRSSWLFADDARVAEWRPPVESLGEGLRVGIAWRSQLMTVERQWSYVPLDSWGQVFAVPGVSFVNLQYDNGHAEILRAEARFGVPIHEMHGLDLKDDFENTVALIANLDLVIAPANSVAELSGALGVPVWRFGARDWTHLGSGTRPWYPTMRVFHPRVGQSLPDALARIAQELRRVALFARSQEGDAPKRGARAHQRRRAAESPGSRLH
ncbi:tetratricopeptide repeat protein [Azospirillum canadense]|uniref:tetratricopeptide repeat protein n=1 Tax=Azospirillum canadense TaxID=403962 RepID=UPI0022275C2A|nr:tetratricopeptide repeat protein [Azospirillum canadense]MCW2239752.1 tetratricopeptide (TPR) repeat protein [Azospirillum canadense]